MTIPSEDTDVMPVVERSGASNAGMWIFFCILLVGGLSLFWMLSVSREAARVPAAASSSSIDRGRISSPPQLILPHSQPSEIADRYSPTQMPLERRAIVVPRREFLAPPPASPPRPRLERPEKPIAEPLPTTLPPAHGINPQRRAPENRPIHNSAIESAPPDEEPRIRAGRLSNPSLTVPQGTIVQAVLETALDSTRPGFVRALVQRDVRSFDGSRVLIHRGSRLYGEYQEGIKRGQDRALIMWTRLIRPDGVTVALNSPASDPLGRAGVKGKVDGKFLQRFGGAILQSVLDIGVGVATREATDGVVVALPGSTQNITPRVSQSEIRPVLNVRHGTSISVFVAQDLDFSSVQS